MSKQLLIQIALVLSGLFVVLILFFQPKYIIDKKKLLDHQEKESLETQVHADKIDQKTVEVINSLMLSLSNVDNSEKKSIFADSIAECYRNSFVFDSTVKYLELAYHNDPTEFRLEKMALGLYEAFQNASSGKRQKELGEKADGFFERILASNPERIDLKIKHAVIKVGIEPMPMAGIKMLKEVIDRHPENIEARLQLGEFQMRVDFVDKAIHQFKEVLQIDPSDLKANVYITQCYLRLSNKDKAEEHLKKLIELNVADPYIESVIEALEAELKKL